MQRMEKMEKAVRDLRAVLVAANEAMNHSPEGPVMRLSALLHEYGMGGPEGSRTHYEAYKKAHDYIEVSIPKKMVRKLSSLARDARGGGRVEGR